ncbi:MAG: hypothetical protein BGO55_29015 [Sphingobacteriales bacterium 50-39]|nr:MerR family transcriptional regulator [Sphingobacteriales bacterium]OJW60593.1 MAG: hypothetical protein BGO55_29015 [Sphingobacteriales bacterium 50-39]
MDTIDTFSMRDVERLMGIKAHTIRIWEKRYGIAEPRRSATNIRFYSNEEVRLLMTVRMLNGYGHKISAIAAMSRDERNRRLDEALEHKPVPGQAEEALIVSLLEADEWRFARVFYAEVHRTIRQDRRCYYFCPNTNCMSWGYYSITMHSGCVATEPITWVNRCPSTGSNGCFGWPAPM